TGVSPRRKAADPARGRPRLLPRRNAASFDALDKVAISSASIMMPTPWITEVAAYARTHPDADLGLHLTLTAEWLTYRWGSVASKDKVPSLLNPDGTFPNNDSVVAVRAKQEEIELELRALIQAFPSVTPDKWKGFYLNAIANLKPGLTEIIVHLGHDDAELRAVTVSF